MKEMFLKSSPDFYLLFNKFYFLQDTTKQRFVIILRCKFMERQNEVTKKTRCYESPKLLQMALTVSTIDLWLIQYVILMCLNGSYEDRSTNDYLLINNLSRSYGLLSGVVELILTSSPAILSYIPFICGEYYSDVIYSVGSATYVTINYIYQGHCCRFRSDNGQRQS